ncbi:glycoside hydrolase family 43 protein [Amnibacterium flavum]|uniref:glycoside hydrolase family 43 protein n=1 Tax=Amnibacterium flavum TaxID=2173173 RepID=UPI001402022B|nr:glycoside hydrolase family 43 protein [Amnibacterium flavum]
MAERRGRRALALSGAAALALCLLSACTGTTTDGSAVDIDLPEPFLIDADFPDPDLLEVDGGYVAYATQSEDSNVQVAVSDDLESWALLETDAFPDLPEWVIPGDTWAPEVSAWGDGYLLFHTSTDLYTGRQCIGLAASASPVGPFVESNDRALVCPEDGAIDASLFIDPSGSPYLLWKVDGNCCGGNGSIWISPVDPGALDSAVAGVAAASILVGEPIRLLDTDELWEGDVVEAPTLISRPDGRYVLFYSGGAYDGLEYAIGWASSDSATGPFVKSREPLLTTESSDFAFIGPGGQDVIGDTMVFHSWDPDHAYRGMHTAPLEWTDDVPSVVLPRRPD